MLLNPGMEGITRPGGWTRDTFTGQEYGEIFVPEGWVAFWKEGLPVPHDPQNTVGYGRPEMQVIQKVPPFLNPPRIHSGDWSLKYFTFYRIHDAGIYQTVTVPNNARLRASFWAHAWSSQLDDPFHSDQTTEDDRENFTFTVGIDPTGGTDPWADSVVWGEGAHIYDTFAQVPVEVVAQGTQVTVFIRSQVLWPFKHCDSYVDDVILEVIDTPTECRGKPRVQYSRTVHVVPQNATLQRFLEIATTAYEKKQTVGFSSDDAGLGDLDDKTAIEWDRTANEQPEYLDFYTTHYPGTSVVFAGDSPLPSPVTLFRQCDEPWGSQTMGTSGITLCQSGCAVVSCTMLGSQVDANTDPAQLLNWLNANNAFTDDGRLYWQKVAQYYNIVFNGYVLWREPGQIADMDIVRAALARGPVIIQVDYRPSTSPLDSHFVVALREIDNDLEIADPWTGTIRLLSQSYWLGSVAASIKALVDYRLDSPPPPPVTPIRPTGTRGHTLLHWIPMTTAGVQNYVQTILPPALKLTTAGGDGDKLVMVRQWSPSTLLIHRRVENGLDRYNPAQAAPFVQRYIADLSPHFNLRDFNQAPLYIVSINEVYECGATANNQAAAAWDIAFMQAIEDTGLNLRGVVYTAPVGNPHTTPEDLSVLLPMVRKAVEGKHLLGKHCYYASVPGDPAFYQQSWRWYGGRFAEDDAYFVSQGLRPYWILGEGGACEATVHPDGVITLNPGAGWKACGSIQRYTEELLWAESWYANWNAVNQGRLLGVCLFTTGGWGWDLFYLQGNDLDIVTANLAQTV